jgi:hypothetical protein
MSQLERIRRKALEPRLARRTACANAAVVGNGDELPPRSASALIHARFEIALTVARSCVVKALHHRFLRTDARPERQVVLRQLARRNIARRQRIIYAAAKQRRHGMATRHSDPAAHDSNFPGNAPHWC